MVEMLIIFCTAVLVVATLLLIVLCRRSSSSSMASLHNKHFFITGASSGIGLAIAKQALLHGAHVTLVSRRLSQLQLALQSLLSETNCSPDSIRFEAADVTDYSALSSALKASSSWKPIDVLICNAGLTRGGYLDSTPIEELDLIVRTNVMGTIHALHAALPALKQRSLEKHPTSIVITASLASLYLLYGHSVYTATKYALKGLAEALRFELLPYNIKVCLICPNFTQTPFLDEIGDKNQEIAQILEKVNLYKREEAENPEKVSRRVMEAVTRGEFLVASGWIGFLLRTVGRGYVALGEPLGVVLLEAICFLPLRLVSLVIIFFYCQTIVKLTKIPAPHHRDNENPLSNKVHQQQ